MARFNRWLPNRAVRMFAGRRLSPIAIVEHRGRRSGRDYRTPVVAFRVDGSYVISLPYGASRDWVRNVLAAGSCTLQIGGRHVTLTEPRLLEPGEGLPLVPAPMRIGLRLLRVSKLLRCKAS